MIFGGELPGDESDSSDEGYVSPPRRSKSEGKPSPSAKSEHPNAVVGGPNSSNEKSAKTQTYFLAHRGDAAASLVVALL